MYRGQDIGSRRQLLDACLRLMRDGDEEILFSILPHISILRSRELFSPLCRLLRRGTRKQQVFSAIALGSLGHRDSIEHLMECLGRPATFRGPGTLALQRATVFALGETGHADSVSALMTVFEMRPVPNRFGRERQRLVLAALGTLSRQGVVEARHRLVEFLHHQKGGLRATAVTELGVSLWNEPEISEELLSRLLDLREDPQEQVRQAAWATLDNLIQLGSDTILKRMRELASHRDRK